MTKKTHLLISTLLTIGLNSAALAQTNAGNTTPLPTSITKDCSSFLKAIANTPNFNGLTTQLQNSVILAAAKPYTNSLKACYQNNACQQAPLSSQPNCFQYLSLWNLLNTTPVTVAPTNTQSPPPQPNNTDATQPPKNNAPTNNLGATPPPNGNKGADTKTPTPENNGKQQKEQINWF